MRRSQRQTLLQSMKAELTATDAASSSAQSRNLPLHFLRDQLQRAIIFADELQLGFLRHYELPDP